MAEQLAIYSQITDQLPEEFLRDVARQVAPDATFKVEAPEEEGSASAGPFYVFDWGDVELSLNVLPPEDLGEHLSGFIGWIADLYENHFDDRGRRIVDRVQATGLVIAVLIEPDRDERVDRVLGAIIHTLEAFVFWDGVLLDTEARLILAPDKSFNAEADVDGPLAGQARWPSELEDPTERQRMRLAQSQVQLDARGVPQLESTTLYTQDDHQTELREPREAARRALCLWSVILYGEDAPRAEALAAVEEFNLWDDLSEEERAFLENEEPTPDERGPFVWRLEALWPLMWALGDIDELGWPAGFCDVPRLANLVRSRLEEKNFIDGARLRPKSEILDAADLVMRQHWAIRDAFLAERQIPADLDWTSGAEPMYVPGCPAAGVVAERHRALNWLIRFGDEDDWDAVDTPT
jgi:hypothetical protein